MQIFKIFRDEEEVDWDEYSGFMIVASSEVHAREIACAHDQGYGGKKELWLNASRVECQLIGQACLDQDAGIVLQDFNAG